MSAMHPLRTDDDFRAAIVSAAESCESGLRNEQLCLSRGDHENAALFRFACEWDGIRAFRMAEHFA